MNKIRLVSAFLLALPLLVFGSNFFFGLFELPEGDDSPGQQLLQSMRDGGLMSMIALSHVVIGGMLLAPRMRFLAGLLQLPMSLGITAFHATMLPDGLAIALVMLVLNAVVLADPPRWRALLGSASP